MNLQLLMDTYFSFREKVDDFASGVRAEYKDQIECREQCSQCCIGGLTTTLIEAVVIGKSAGLRREKIHELAGLDPIRKNGNCAFLTSNELCHIYEHRPLICRTQGIPLSYPDTDSFSCCSMNFTDVSPPPESALELSRMEAGLFVINMKYCKLFDMDPLARVAMDRISENIITLLL